MLPKNGCSGISMPSESEKWPTIRTVSNGTMRLFDTPGNASGRKPLRGPNELHAYGIARSTALMRTSSTSPGSAPST